MPLSPNTRSEPNPPLDRARVIRAREMYAEGSTVSRILARCEMSLGTLYACLDGVPFGKGGERMAAIPRRRQVTGKRRRALKADDGAPVNRSLRTAERQVRDIETPLAGRERPPFERDVRMLASLTRTLRVLHGLRKQAGGQHASETLNDPGDEDTIRHSVEALRQDLSRRLHAMSAGRAADDGGPDTEAGPKTQHRP
ncbi:hypothetical protein [Pseudorhodoplanes sp.]|uniref:hypothetical protein n=1 Tax=Pseudorhodoplanes sp. TaxID=1934341 RepID=UPI002C1B2883|nr:hypothetical protein [Pseudorhodoplanes sp.]HWV51225.1 hypothetical protein [Pseudorhodoplanes sp.]